MSSYKVYLLEGHLAKPRGNFSVGYYQPSGRLKAWKMER